MLRMHVICCCSLSHLQRAGKEILILNVAPGGGSWAREFRGRLRTRAGRQLATQETRRRISKCLGLRYGCTTCFNFHTLSYCNQRGVSLFLSSSSFSRLRRATRIYPTDTAWHSASGNVSARTNPLPLVRMLSCVNSVWDFGRLQTSQNFLCPSDHTRHCPFFLPASVGVHLSGSSAGATQWGGIQRMCPTRHRSPPPFSSDVHHRLIIVRRTRVRSPQLRRHR